MRLQIVATESVPRAAEEAFADLGPISLDDGRDPGLLSAAEVLIVRTSTVDRTLLERASRLRVIARTGVGLDGIDLDEASRRRVPVIYAPDAGTVPIAEGTLALIFATSKRLMELNAALLEGRWHHRYLHDIRDLAGSTLGIVGLGRIGSEVARLAHALGMRVIGHDPRKPDPAADRHIWFVQRASLDQVIRHADILTLHCGLNDTSRGMINRELLATTKPGAILINASRGGLIAGDSVLLEALERGWLSAIGLDVFGSEPPDSDSPLLHDRRVVSTPHAIGLTRAWNERVFSSLARDVRSLVNGRLPQFIANPEILVGDSQTNSGQQGNRL
jgi:D-3-phosphoglycerate dehydrogenase / 2-oxoglutarate reductase